MEYDECAMIKPLYVIPVTNESDLVHTRVIIG